MPLHRARSLRLDKSSLVTCSEVGKTTSLPLLSSPRPEASRALQHASTISNLDSLDEDLPTGYDNFLAGFLDPQQECQVLASRPKHRKRSTIQHRASSQNLEPPSPVSSLPSLSTPSSPRPSPVSSLPSLSTPSSPRGGVDHYDFIASIPEQLISDGSGPSNALNWRQKRCTVQQDAALAADGSKEVSNPSKRSSRTRNPSKPMVDKDEDDARMLSARQRSACESLRLLVLGRVGNEKSLPSEKHMIFDERRGTREEVVQFSKLWGQLDEDGSGDVDLFEFDAFLSKTRRDRLLSGRCVDYLMDCGMEKGVTAEDMLKLIWLRADKEDLDVMGEWVREEEFKRRRTEPPPLLSKRQRRELCKTFEHLARGVVGALTFNDLLQNDLMDEDMVKKYDANAGVDFNKFLEIFCPNGFRAHKDAEQVINSDGQLLRHIHWKGMAGWVLDDNVESFIGGVDKSDAD